MCDSSKAITNDIKSCKHDDDDDDDDISCSKIDDFITLKKTKQSTINLPEQGSASYYDAAENYNIMADDEVDSSKHCMYSNKSSHAKTTDTNLQDFKTELKMNNLSLIKNDDEINSFQSAKECVTKLVMSSSLNKKAEIRFKINSDNIKTESEASYFNSDSVTQQIFYHQEPLNETNTQLQALYKHIEMNPVLFVSTIISAHVNKALQLSEEEAESKLLSLVNVFCYHRNLPYLILPLLLEELKSVNNSSQLFRKNSGATRIMTMCCKILGKTLIEESVSPVIEEIIALDHTIIVEYINDSDITEKEIDDNISTLQIIITRLIKSVIFNLPQPLEYLCRMVYRLIEKRFCGYGYIGISNLLFLRFICPLIVKGIPSRKNVGVKINPINRSNLVIVSKFIQNAANLSEPNNHHDECNRIKLFRLELQDFVRSFYESLAESRHNDFELSAAVETDDGCLRKIIVARKKCSLRRLECYLEHLSRSPHALSFVANCMTGWLHHTRRKKHLSFYSGSSTKRRSLILSPLHLCVFFFKQCEREETPEQCIDVRRVVNIGEDNSKSGRPLVHFTILRMEATDSDISVNLESEFEKKDCTDFIESIKQMKITASYIDKNIHHPLPRWHSEISRQIRKN